MAERAQRRAARLLPAAGPARRIALADLLITLGASTPRFALPIWLTHHANLSTGQVGLALSLMGVAGLLASFPAGRLSDRAGPRGVLVAAGLASGATTLLLAVASSFWPVAAILALEAVAHAAQSSSSGALIATLLEQDDRVRLSAYLRSVHNVGFTFAGLAAGVVIGVDQRWLYVALFVLAALAQALVAVIRRGLPAVPGRRPAAGAGRLGALRDRPYLAVALVCGVARVNAPLFEIAMPLWIVGHTSAPRGAVGALFALNTVMVVALQVRVARGSDSSAGGLRAQRRGLLATVVACAAFAAAAGPASAVEASALAVAAIVALTLAEMLTSAAEWSFRFGLAPAGRQGEYGGAFAIPTSIADIAGPVGVVALTSGLGSLGWALVAGLCVALALVAPGVVGRASDSRLRA